MLIHLAIGDAYGACFEYSDPDSARPNDLSGYPANLAYDAIGRGRYTDDTQMAVAVAETLIGGSTSRLAFADSFVRCFRRDPRHGYSRGMQAFIETCRDGTDFLARISPASDRSGAAMRASPIGLLPDEDDVMRVAEIQARVTHDTDGGVAAAKAAALMAHALRRGLCPRAELPRWLAERIPGARWDEPWFGPVGARGIDSVRAALWAVAGGNSMATILRAAVAWTGDVDTVAAVAMGAASCDESLLDDLPSALLDGLESGPYGRRFLEDLDAGLERRLVATTSALPGAR